MAPSQWTSYPEEERETMVLAYALGQVREVRRIQQILGLYWHADDFQEPAEQPWDKLDDKQQVKRSDVSFPLIAILKPDAVKGIEKHFRKNGLIKAHSAPPISIDGDVEELDTSKLVEQFQFFAQGAREV